MANIYVYWNEIKEWDRVNKTFHISLWSCSPLCRLLICTRSSRSSRTREKRLTKKTTTEWPRPAETKENSFHEIVHRCDSSCFKKIPTEWWLKNVVFFNNNPVCFILRTNIWRIPKLKIIQDMYTHAHCDATLPKAALCTANQETPKDSGNQNHDAR